MKMKFALTALLLPLLSTNCFASSVCIFSIPGTVGSEATVICDGKSTNAYEVGDTWMAKQTLTLKELATKGYKISSEVRSEDSDQYTLVKD